MTVPGDAVSPTLSGEPARVEMIGQPGPIDPTALGAPTHRTDPTTFPTSKPAPSSGGGGSGKLIRLLVLVAVVGVAIYSRVGQVSKSGVQAFHQQSVDLMQRINDSLKTIKDVPTAKAASGPINQAFRELSEHQEKNKDKKAKQADIDAVGAEFRPREEALQKQFLEELARVAKIPDALEALDLKTKPGDDDAAGKAAVKE
jgi:hypothetical protein